MGVMHFIAVVSVPGGVGLANRFITRGRNPLVCVEVAFLLYYGSDCFFQVERSDVGILVLLVGNGLWFGQGKVYSYKMYVSYGHTQVD